MAHYGYPGARPPLLRYRNGANRHIRAALGVAGIGALLASKYSLFLLVVF